MRSMVSRGAVWVGALVVLVSGCGGGGSDSGVDQLLPSLVTLPQQSFPEGRWNGSIGTQLGFGEGVALADGSAWFLVRDPLSSALGVIITRPASAGGSPPPAYGRFLDAMLDTVTPIAFELDEPTDALLASGESVYTYPYGFGTRKNFYLQRTQVEDDAPELATVVGNHAGGYLVGVERYLGVQFGAVGITIDSSGYIRGMTRDRNATCNLDGQISESTRGEAYEVQLRTSERNRCPLVGVDVHGVAFLPQFGEGLLFVLKEEAQGVMAGLELDTVPSNVGLPPGLFDYLQ